MNNTMLYTVTVLIWGTSWFAITFQMGVVDPLVSTAYRFVLASMLLLAYCRWRGLSLHFAGPVHGWLLLQGLCLFGFNYWLIYESVAYITSGLVAVLFSTIVLMNLFNSALLLGTKIKASVFVGAVLGLGGIILVFQPELTAFNQAQQGVTGLWLALGATYIASLGNILSARNQKQGVPVIQSNALGMGYGGLAMLLIASVMGVPFTFDWSWGYLLSLGYLAIFASIIAFGCYLTLLGRIGAERAAYATLLFPVVALGISTLFEGYVWSFTSLIGLSLVLLGNFIVLAPQRLAHLWLWRPTVKV